MWILMIILWVASGFCGWMHVVKKCEIQLKFYDYFMIIPFMCLGIVALAIAILKCKAL